MRYALARLLETVFVHTALYKWLDGYKVQPASAGPGLLRRVARALRGGGMSNWFGSGALQAYARWSGRPVLVIWERVRKPGAVVVGASWSECFGLVIFHPDRDEPEYVNGTDSEERARAFLAARRDCKVLFRTKNHYDYMSRSVYPGNSGASSDSGSRAGASEGDVWSDCSGGAGASEGDVSSDSGVMRSGLDREFGGLTRFWADCGDAKAAAEAADGGGWESRFLRSVQI